MQLPDIEMIGPGFGFRQHDTTAPENNRPVVVENLLPHGALWISARLNDGTELCLEFNDQHARELHALLRDEFGEDV